MRIRAGETCKTLASAEEVLSTLARERLERSSSLVVIGGGSLGDLGGLVASLYLRGIDLIQVPTSLLSMVDSSVGGKTAINLPEGKNLAGSFWPAREVLIDSDFLSSLSQSEFRSGLGEVLKMAIGLSKELFTLLETAPPKLEDKDLIAEIIDLALAAKIRIVEEDPNESGSRRLLNLGHSLGHALECASNFSLPHGEAVVQGIFFALRVSEGFGCISREDAESCRALLQRFAYQESQLPDLDEVRGYMLRDKKMLAGQLAAVLPSARGESKVQVMSVDEFIARAPA
jgi:3-dehydroquinate synthetase